MGGCASKPKGLKNDMDVAPAPAPAPVKESESKIDGETTEIVAEVKKIQEGEEEVVKVEEGQDNKRRSLGQLFEENKEEKKLTDGEDRTKTETNVISHEPVKDVEEPKTENATKESNANAPDNEKIKTETKEKPIPVAVGRETEKPIDVSPAVETEKVENSEKKKTKAEGKEVVTTPNTEEKEKPIEVAPAVEIVKIEKESEEKKTKEEEKGLVIQNEVKEKVSN